MPYNRRELGLRFVSRIYGPRSLGCLLSSVFIGAVLLTQSDVSDWVWLAMIFNLLVWPTLAYQCARRAPDPFKTEMRSIAADGLYAGFWAGQMALNILPSALLLSMVTMNAMAAGGWRLVRASIALQTLALLLTLSLSGFKVSLPSSTLQLVACLPMLVIYPLMVARVSYRLSVQLAQHKTAFKLISKLDGMTRLLHHAAWKEKLDEVFPRCRSGEVTAMLALIDIDDFKIINDHHGHLVGDAIIGRLANLLRSGLGETGVVGRYGGDEFCVLLINVSASEATDYLNDLRKRFADWTDADAPALASLSIGLVPYSDQFATESAWLKATDKALYQAKRGGKNRLWVQELPIFMHG
jgi:diguanylate cyclase